MRQYVRVGAMLKAGHARRALLSTVLFVVLAGGVMVLTGRQQVHASGWAPTDAQVDRSVAFVLRLAAASDPNNQTPQASLQPTSWPAYVTKVEMVATTRQCALS